MGDPSGQYRLISTSHGISVSFGQEIRNKKAHGLGVGGKISSLVKAPICGFRDNAARGLIDLYGVVGMIHPGIIWDILCEMTIRETLCHTPIAHHGKSTTSKLADTGHHTLGFGAMRNGMWMDAKRCTAATIVMEFGSILNMTTAGITTVVDRIHLCGTTILHIGTGTMIGFNFATAVVVTDS